MATCFFFGHRDAPESLRIPIYEAVVCHIVNFGVSDFVVGHYGNFDRMATQAVIAAKELFPNITLTLLLPYHPSIRPVEISDGFDGSHYPPSIEKVPLRAAIAHANKYSVDHSDYLIVYARCTAGNAWDLLKYAKARTQNGLPHITNLAEKYV